MVSKHIASVFLAQLQRVLVMTYEDFLDPFGYTSKLIFVMQVRQFKKEQKIYNIFQKIIVLDVFNQFWIHLCCDK